MRKYVILLILLTALISCGKKEPNLPVIPEPYNLSNLQNMPFYADTVLSDTYPEIFKATASSTILVRPQQIQTHLGELAEMYLQYQFIGMISKKYALDDNIIDVELIQFADETNAYGFYALFRPHGSVTEKIGVESFQAGNTRYLVKGDFVLQMSSAEKTEQSDATLLALCSRISNDIIGTVSTPPLFLLFPFSGKITPSTRYYSTAYLDIPGLNAVYTSSYLIDNDTITLFLAMDTSGNSFAYLNHYASQQSDKTIEINKFEFPPGKSIAFPTEKNGIIVAGLKSQKLLGTTAYKPKSTDKLLSGWIKGIQ